MTPEQAAAYIMAMSACAIAEIEAMKRVNLDFEHARNSDRAQAPPFTASDFRAVIEQFGISHNAVLITFEGCRR